MTPPGAGPAGAFGLGWLQSGPTVPIVKLSALPVFCNALYPTAAEARSAPAGDLDLQFAPDTGYLWNAAFDPALASYNPAYENSLHYSPTFAAFASELADRLVRRYGLRGRRVVEIGSGEGNFLAMLCERGVDSAIGYDPSFDPRRSKVVTSERMHIVAQHYPTDRSVDAALVICQHVLEHVGDPEALVAGVRRSLENRDTAVYFEVPDATYMLSQRAVWDLIYEHRSYFAAPTLSTLFRRHGFDVVDVDRTFGDQYLYLEARTAATPDAATDPAVPDAGGGALAKLGELAAGFGGHVAALRETWTTRLEEMVGSGRVAVWGAGSKGVTFLNLVAPGRDVAHVVDINPNKTGLHVPGTGQQVLSPDMAVAAGLDHVVVMNPLYVPEISRQLAALGCSAPVVAVNH